MKHVIPLLSLSLLLSTASATQVSQITRVELSIAD